ncbi:MAG: chromate transporter [Humidesulfovibrio sp.]|nr:chromate transporter [Humidesulfovibrio sp.]
MHTNPPTFREFRRYWLRLGFVNFGGPDAQIARMRADIVAARGWVEDGLFERARSFCLLLPGSRAQQLAVYLGWRLFGIRGGLAAGLFSLLPSVLLMLALSGLAVVCGGAPLMAGFFRGLAAAVVVLVAQALWRASKEALVHPVFYGFAAVSFLMGYGLRLKFYGVIVVAVLMSLWLGQVRPDIFCPGGALEKAGPQPLGQSPWRRVGRLGAGFAALWLVVALPVFFFSGPGSLLPRILNFYTRASFLAFGEPYGVLSFVSDMALRLGWTGQDQLALGLGLAGLAPGPLVLAVQHAGFMTAYGHPGGLTPLAAGALGGLLATFGLILPGFFLVFAGAPHLESLLASPRLRSAFTGISAAMVGVILKLDLLFATATFWPRGLGGGLDVFPLALAAAAGLVLWRWRIPASILLLACGVLGAVWPLLG